ncbi:MAG: hypothetical protein JJT94_17500 [Bernardetiaceae bacterium]|nr:hypothetical protein [Bernardetiaceae bacterium]
MKIIAWIIGICLLPLSLWAQTEEIQLYKKTDKQIFAQVKNDFFMPVQAQETNFTYSIADKYDAKLVLGNLENGMQHFFVVPKQNGKIIVEVYKDEQFYQNFTFDVISTPKPDIQLRLGNRLVNLAHGETLETLRDFYLYAEPDAAFAENAPQDAIYKISEAKGTLVLGRRALTNFQFVNGKIADEDLETIAKHVANYDADAKDKKNTAFRIFIEVEKVHRTNYEGDLNVVTIKPNFNLPIRIQ